MLTSLDPNFHDGIVQDLVVDFQLKQTRLTLKQWRENNDGGYLLSELIFTGVAWQDFKNFSTFNCIWGIEISDTYADFEKNQKEYLDQMRNYFAVGELENIKADTSLKYYYFTSSAGFDGFVICKNLLVTERSCTSEKNHLHNPGEGF
jgi:hypothetical protein